MHFNVIAGDLPYLNVRISNQVEDISMMASPDFKNIARWAGSCLLDNLSQGYQGLLQEQKLQLEQMLQSSRPAPANVTVIKELQTMIDAYQELEQVLVKIRQELRQNAFIQPGYDNDALSGSTMDKAVNALKQGRLDIARRFNNLLSNEYDVSFNVRSKAYLADSILFLSEKCALFNQEQAVKNRQLPPELFGQAEFWIKNFSLIYFEVLAGHLHTGIISSYERSIYQDKDYEAGINYEQQYAGLYHQALLLLGNFMQSLRENLLP